MTARDVPFDEEVRERACVDGAWAHVAPLAEVEAAQAKIARDCDARVALADLRTLLDSPLPTRPVRARLLACAIAALEARL